MSAVTHADWRGTRVHPAHASATKRKRLPETRAHHPALHYAALVIAVLAGAITGTAMADIEIAETKAALAGLVLILLAYAVHRRPRKS